MGVINEFLLGAIWLGLVIAFGVVGWKAVQSGSFQAVSERYYGRKAQGLGGVCLGVAVVSGLFFLQTVLRYFVSGDGLASIFFLGGAALGAWLALRYYLKVI